MTGGATSKPADSSDRGAVTIFCDDVRKEEGGKLLYIGVYGDVLSVPKFPFVLPSLVVRVMAYTALSHAFEKFELKLLRDDDVLFVDDHDMEVLGTHIESLRKKSHDDEIEGVKRFNLTSEIRIVPFVVEKDCTFRVRITTESGEIRAGALRIERKKSDAATEKIEMYRRHTSSKA